MRIMRRYWLLFVLFVVMLSIVLSIAPIVQDHFTQDRFFPVRVPDTHQPTLPPVPRKMPPAYKPVPGVRLVIPAIAVNAAIEPVGVLPDGSMAVPVQQQWEDVGWYQRGPYPGERGSAVIDGHLDRPGGLPAVFWRLHMLHVGDDVLLIMNGQRPLHFRVLSSNVYTPAAAPRSLIFGDETGSFLNLITCAGKWVPSLQQTTMRLVVHTVLL
jgi:Sortase domain